MPDPAIEAAERAWNADQLSCWPSFNAEAGAREALQPIRQPEEAPRDWCWSRGPRIGAESTPVCFLPDGHVGLHQSHPDSGFSESWGGPKHPVPESDRHNWWTPEETRNV